MRILHLLAGLGAASGVANIARRFARAQTARGDQAVMLAPAFKWNPVYFGPVFALRALLRARRADEIWVHCSWTFPVWYGAALARCLGKRLVVVPEGSFDPKRLRNRAGWKKRCVAPIDRRVLRQADAVLALCPDESDWIRAFEPAARVRSESVPLFLPAHPPPPGAASARTGRALHVLFLGRAGDPLKGVAHLERAVEEINARRPPADREPRIELRVVSDHFGDALERDWAWCDALCLPTLSDNFGLVVAEALERGKVAVTTDGASAWENRPGVVYLKGYREGSGETRVRLLRTALERIATGGAQDERLAGESV